MASYTGKGAPKQTSQNAEKEEPKGILFLAPIAGIPSASTICTADLAAYYLDSFNHLDSKNTNTLRKHATSVS